MEFRLPFPDSVSSSAIMSYFNSTDYLSIPTNTSDTSVTTPALNGTIVALLIIEKNYETFLVAVVTWFTVASFFGAVIGNLLIIIVYVKHRHLRTPFNVYIFNLAVTDLLIALTAMPGNFITNIYGYWPWTTAACTLLLYCNTVIGSALRFQHLLISVSRLWAVTLPVQFRSYHTFRTANVIVFGTWILVHAIELPVVILGRDGALVKPTEKPCILHTEHLFHLALFSQIVGFILPEILVVLTSAWIFHIVRNRQVTKRNKIRQSSQKHVITHQPVTVSTSESDSKTDTRTDTKYATTDGSPVIGGDLSTFHSSSTTQAGHLISVTKSHHTSSHDRVLAYLVVAIIVCWTPNHVYFTMFRVNNYWNGVYFAVQYCVFYANSWLNPILCYFALVKFRVAINNLFFCRG